jgi:hypothetical protein
VKSPKLTEDSKIVLGSGASSSIAGTVYLGRPWGNYAQVVFQNSNYQNIIIPVGWEGLCSIFFPKSPLEYTVNSSSQLGILPSPQLTSFSPNITTQMPQERESHGQKL